MRAMHAAMVRRNWREPAEQGLNIRNNMPFSTLWALLRPHRMA